MIRIPFDREKEIQNYIENNIELFFGNVIFLPGDFYIYTPNAFTPDGDGVNDVFQISGGNIIDMECLIFNRWGQVIHSLDSPEDFWNGTYQGFPCQDGTYIWKLKYTDFNNKKYELSGHINLIR